MYNDALHSTGFATAEMALLNIYSPSTRNAVVKRGMTFPYRLPTFLMVVKKYFNKEGGSQNWLAELLQALKGH